MMESYQLTGEIYRDFFATNSADDELCAMAADQAASRQSNAEIYHKFFETNSVDDEMCAMAADQSESRQSNDQTYTDFFEMNSTDDDLCARATAQIEQDNSVRQNDASNETKIRRIIEGSPAAKYYSENFFYKFEMWPKYLKDMFVSNSIQKYTYAMRNKICLFFWGNGGTYEIMKGLSEYFSPQSSLKTYNERREYSSSHHKCQQLFKTYSEQLHNPNYCERYYYYNIHRGCMLYMDNVPRVYGQRQRRNEHMPPSWY